MTVLPLIPALLLVAVSLLLAHWFPPFVGERLPRLAAYGVGVLCVIIPLSWHQFSFGAIWWQVWLFFSVGGAAVAVAWGVDKILELPAVKETLAELSRRGLGMEEAADGEG